MNRASGSPRGIANAPSQAMGRAGDGTRTARLRCKNVSIPFAAALFVVMLLWPLLMGGCRTFTPPAQARTVGSANDNTTYYIHYEATRRGTYIRHLKDGSIRIAAEPPPDAAMDATANLSASLSALLAKVPVEGQVDAKVVEQIVELAGRTQAVVLMRDAMFRLAEMHLNEVIDKETYLVLFNKAMAGALAIAASDAELAKTMLATLLREAEVRLEQQQWSAIESALAEPERRGDLMRDFLRTVPTRDMTKED